MIMRAGATLWQPIPEKVPRVFAEWLKREYRSELQLGWNRRTHRWAVFAWNNRKKTQTFLLTLETDDGLFIPLNDRAKRKIKQGVLHATQVVRSDERMDRVVRDADEKKAREFAAGVHDILMDPVNARRMTGNSSRKGAGVTARKALKDARKKRGE